MSKSTSQWAMDLLEPHLDNFDKNNRSAPYFAKAIRVLIEDAKRLDWLDKNEGIEWSIDYGLNMWSDDKGKRTLREAVDEHLKKP